jgi:hypothetical protein
VVVEVSGQDDSGAGGRLFSAGTVVVTSTMPSIRPVEPRGGAPVRLWRR